MYLPALEFDGPLPEHESYFMIGERYWKFPKDGSELIDAVRWAAAEELPVEISGPEFLLASLVQHPQKPRLCLHLVNYDAKNRTVEGVEVKLRLPDHATAKEVRLISSDAAELQVLAGHSKAGEVYFRVPEVKVYSLAAVSW